LVGSRNSGRLDPCLPAEPSNLPTSHLSKAVEREKPTQQQRIHRHLRANTMNKRDITGTITDRTGLTTKKAKEAVEAVLKAMKQGLKEDRSIDLGRLGKLRTAKLTRRGRVVGGLKNVGRCFFHYSKHAKTVKLKSKLDLSNDPLPTIVHPPPAKPEPVVFIKRPCAVAYPRWRRRNTRYSF
jgi:nucleoid DNA-binding protein